MPSTYQDVPEEPRGGRLGPDEPGLSTDEAQRVLELVGIEKAYGHVKALRGVDLTLHAGEVHALVGDNGAGKSTLLKVAAGTIRPDAGEIRVEGQALSFRSPTEARERGIETVYQDLALADDRSAVANVYLGRELTRRGILGRLGLLDRRQMTERTRARFEELAIPIVHVGQPVRLLSGGQRQGVAIARAAMWARNLVLMDEPTAALGVRQRDTVDALVQRLRADGFGVLLISHNVPEVLELADRVTVLRLGARVASRPTGSVDLEWVVRAMVGGNGE